jgi:O-antigen/teichoic acid export membrane protein
MDLNGLKYATHKLRSDSMTSQGLMMAAFSLLGGGFSYLYQLSMGILLTPAQYGILFSLTSLFVLFMTAYRTIQVSIAKFTSSLKLVNKWGRINYLWTLSLKQAFVIGLVTFAFLALLTPVLSGFFNIDNHLLTIVLFSSSIFTFAIPVNRGILQGLQRFLPLGLSTALLQFLRFATAITLVYLGSGIYGGLLAFPVAYTITFFVTLFFLRDLRGFSAEKFKVSGLPSYASLALLSFFAFAVLTNADVLLAKHYLSPEEAGNYSAISVLGRIALYAPMGVTVVMFPKTSELSELGITSRPILTKAMLLTLLLGGGVLIVYLLSPQFITNFLFGNKYPLSAPYLFEYGLAMLLFSICFLMVNLFLSLNRTNVAYFLLGAALVQILLIRFFHADISQIVNAVLISSALSVALMVFLYLTGRR